MKIIGIIPARFASTRFPGKPLIDIQGKSMIQRVYEQSVAAHTLHQVIVATDHLAIKEHVLGFGGNVVMTDPSHQSGTDRCYEAFINSGSDAAYVINIQGDEPFLDPEQINELGAVCDGKAQLVTQMIAVNQHEVLFDEGEVKIVLNDEKEAIYFSRMVIPFLKGYAKEHWHLHHSYFRHVGMYAYRTDILKAITKLPISALEKAESLEQLRWLENGFKIKCVLTQYDSHCIDMPEDVSKVLRLMGKL